MECAAGAGLKRSNVRGFRRGGGMIMLRRLWAVQALGPVRNFQETVTLRKQSEAHLLNRTDRPAPMPGEGDVKYLDGDFRVVRPGAFVRCAVTGVAIPLEELRYWSVDLQ